MYQLGGFTLIDHRPARRGFTLIELSIVLVIIGLITAGVLTGRDLIRAAELRATIAQVEKFNSAVNTFRGKYGYIPGDILPTVASQFGFFTATGANAGTTGYGNGNWLLEPSGNDISGEQLLFWRHLSDANLIDGAYSMPDSATNSTSLQHVPLSETNQNIGKIVPPAKLGGSNFFRVGEITSISVVGGVPSRSIAAANYYLLSHLNQEVLGIATGNVGGISPIDANSIDSKLDDGKPNTGIVMGFYGQFLSTGGAITAPNVAATSTDGDCTIGDGLSASDTYNLVKSSGGNTLSCGLIFKFQ